MTTLRHITITAAISIVSALSFATHTQAATIVVDAETGHPLAKASVFDSNGTVVAICTDNGEIPYVGTDAYPITIQYIGYTPLTLDAPADGPVEMHATEFNLSEIEIVSQKQQVLQLTGYLREYSTLTTSKGDVTMFREKSVDFMIPSKDVKRFAGWLSPRVLSSRSYYRFTDSEGLDSVSNTFSQHFSWSDWVGIFKNRRLPNSISSNENTTDTIWGKYTPSQVWTRNGDSVTLDIDMLAHNKNLEWVPRMALFMGTGNDFTRFSIKYRFDDVTASDITADNIAHMSYNIESSRSGRDMHRLSFREQPLYVNTYAELYITDRRYISVGAARRLEKQPTADSDATLTAPDNIPPLPQPVVDLIARVNDIDHDHRRGTAAADHRYIGKPNKERFSIIGTVKKVAKRIGSLIG